MQAANGEAQNDNHEVQSLLAALQQFTDHADTEQLASTVPSTQQGVDDLVEAAREAVRLLLWAKQLDAAALHDPVCVLKMLRKNLSRRLKTARRMFPPA